MNSQEPKKILIATTNQGKLREYEHLFSELPLAIGDLSKYPNAAAPDEDGTTFRENAIRKAAGYASQTGEWIVADDSGLEIDALGGEPGVFSARFGGVESSYAEKMKLVLDRLESSKEQNRNPRFVCSIALAGPDGTIAIEAAGECRGTISREPRGTNGFGYDPIFVPDGYSSTFGEMDDAKKHELSHRARAGAEFIRKLLDFIGV